MKKEDEFYIFTTKGEYIKNENKYSGRVITVDSEEIFKFAIDKQNENLISDNVLRIIEFLSIK